MPDAERVRQRLELSDGELRCPMKGQIAVARCRQLQEETAAEQRPCLCNVGRAAMGVELVVIAEAPADPIATTIEKYSKVPGPRLAPAKALATPVSPGGGKAASGGSSRATPAARGTPPPSKPPASRLALLKARATKKGNTVDRVLVRDTVASAPSRRSDTQGPAQERSPGGADVPATGVGFDEWLARKREKDAAETAPLPKKIRERHSVERAVERLVEEGEVRPEARELLVEHATKTKEKNVANDSMTLGDVAKLLGVHPSRISQLWNAGKLGKDREKEGGSWKYPRAVVEALKAERDGEAPAAKKTRRTAPPPTRKERPMREENPAEGSELLVVARKLRWLISGLADDLVQLDEVYTYAKSDDVDRVLS